MTRNLPPALLRRRRRSGGGGGGGPPPGPAGPGDFAGLELWLQGGVGLFKDDAATQAATVDADVIAVWQDQSGNGHHATQTVNGSRPTLDLTTGLNGLPTVRFVPSSQFLNLPDFAAAFSSAVEFWCVLRAEQATAFGEGPWRLGTGGGGHDDIYPYLDGSVWVGVGSTARKQTGIPAGVTITAYNLLRILSTASEFTVHYNGVEKFTTATNAVGWPTAPSIGKTVGGSFWNGRMAEMFVYSEERSSEDRDALAAYILDRYGI